MKKILFILLIVLIIITPKEIKDILICCTLSILIIYLCAKPLIKQHRIKQYQKQRSLDLLEEQNNLIKQEIELLKEKGKN